MSNQEIDALHKRIQDISQDAEDELKVAYSSISALRGEALFHQERTIYLDRRVASLEAERDTGWQLAGRFADALYNLRKPTEHDRFPQDYLAITIAEGRQRELEKALADYEQAKKERDESPRDISNQGR